MKKIVSLFLLFMLSACYPTAHNNTISKNFEKELKLNYEGLKKIEWLEHKSLDNIQLEITFDKDIDQDKREDIFYAIIDGIQTDEFYNGFLIDVARVGFIILLYEEGEYIGNSNCYDINDRTTEQFDLKENSIIKGNYYYCHIPDFF